MTKRWSRFRGHPVGNFQPPAATCAIEQTDSAQSPESRRNRNLSLSDDHKKRSFPSDGLPFLIHGAVRFRQRKWRDLDIKLLGSLIDHLVGAVHCAKRGRERAA